MFEFHLLIVILLFAGENKINGGDAASRGVLLTPEDGCGYSKVQNNRIVGGAPARNGAWPWMALLGYKNGTNFQFKCGGTLITTRHVLSAAHCIHPELHFVRFGEYDTRTKEDGPHEDVFVHLAVPHERHNDLLKINDISLIHLVRDVVFNDRISPICLPLQEHIQNRSFVGSNPFVAGWGLLEEPQKDIPRKQSPILMQTQVPVHENEKCKMDYKRIGKFLADIQFEDGVICAGIAAGNGGSVSESNGVCCGDSGGPLMLPIHDSGKFPFYQIGIVSHGVGCRRPDIPAIYVDVIYYIEWIEKTIRG